MEYAVPSDMHSMYDVKDPLTNITEKGYECRDYIKSVERIIDTGNLALFEYSRNVNRYLALAKKTNKVCVMNSYEVDPQRTYILFSRGTQILEKFKKF
jgi:hypothetical protein